MEIIIPQTDLHQDCLDKLSRALDLVLKTAEAASAENNHKVVIQSAREVTRLAGLIHKMTTGPTNPGRAPRASLAAAKAANPFGLGQKTSSRPEEIGQDKPAAGQTGKTDINQDDLIMPDLEMHFTPVEMAYWDGLPDNVFKNFSENYRELQALGKEAADFLLDANQGSGAADYRETRRLW